MSLSGMDSAGFLPYLSMKIARRVVEAGDVKVGKTYGGDSTDHSKESGACDIRDI